MNMPAVCAACRRRTRGTKHEHPGGIFLASFARHRARPIPLSRASRSGFRNRGCKVSVPKNHGWDRRAIVEALQAASVGGVAPSATQWRVMGAGRPTTAVVKHVMGSWREACAAAKLLTREQAQQQAKRERQAAAKLSRPARQRREEALASLREQVEAGALVIRQASPELRARWAAERAERRAAEPRALPHDEQVPGVEPRSRRSRRVAA
jgi:hypothetical protein